MSVSHTIAVLLAAVAIAGSARAPADSAPWMELASHARESLVVGLDVSESARVGSLEAREAGRSLAEAERLYTQLIDSAPASDEELSLLHLNRGNARLARGDAPGALFDFKRANILMPGDLLIESRILASRQILKGGSEADAIAAPLTLGDQSRSLAWRVARLVPPQWRLYATIGAGGAFWFFVGTAFLSGGRRHRPVHLVRRVCHLGAAGCGLVAVAMTALTLFEYLNHPPINEVVVLASDCRSYREPGEIPADASISAELRGEPITRGTELRVLATDDLATDTRASPAWLKVRTTDSAPSSSPVWVRSVDVGFVDRGR